MMKNSEETFKELQHKFQKLNEENKRLRLKARSIDVLSNLLENSQDENKQLKEHILELQLRSDPADSPEELSNDQEKTSSGGGDSACRDLHSSDSSPQHENSYTEEIPLTSQEPPPVVQHSIPEDIKVFQDNVQQFQAENVLLTEEVEKICESLSSQEIREEDGEVMAALVQLRTKLQKYDKETNTRKSFIDILASEQNTLESKITEAMTDKSEVVDKLKSELDQNKDMLKEVKRALHQDEESLDSSRTSSVTSYPSSLEAHRESFVLVNKQRSVQDDRKESSSLDVQDASPMHSVDNPPETDPLTSGYVIVQELQEKVKVITREKEELLNVNHQWDQQYRQIHADKNREIANLQEELLRARQEGDAIRVRDEERMKEFDRIWTQAQETLEKEKQAKDNYIQQKESLEARMRQLEVGFQQVQRQYEEEKCRNQDLEENMKRLTQTMNEWTPLPSMNVEQQSQEHITHQAYQQQHLIQSQQAPLPQPPPGPSAPTLHINRPPAIGESIHMVPPAEVACQGGQLPQSKGNIIAQGVTVEQIEMLKQQINIYAEDFRTERADRERIQAEKEAMKEEMDALKENLTALQQQVRIYEEDFKREKSDKERLQRQLRDVQGVPPPEYHPAPRVTLEQVREQQRILQEMIDRYSTKTQTRYNPAYPRGNVYKEANRQWMQARGPTQNSERRVRYDDMFHGGDVVPDTEMDVKDGGRDKDLGPVIACPHCGIHLKAMHLEHAMSHIQGCRP